MAAATMFTRSGGKLISGASRESRGFEDPWLGESVQAPVGVVEYRPAFEAANLPGRRPASGVDIVDEPLVGAECFRVWDSCLLTNFLNRLGVHWRLHLTSTGRWLIVSWDVARFIHFEIFRPDIVTPLGYAVCLIVSEKGNPGFFQPLPLRSASAVT